MHGREDYYDGPTPGQLMDQCRHGHACVRLTGRLCMEDPDWGRHGTNREIQEAYESAARWAGCEGCEHWEDARDLGGIYGRR